MTSPQLAEWVRTRVPDFQPDHAKYLGVVIGPDASAHRWTKVRNKFVAVCAPICTSQSLVWRLVSFKFYALSVLDFALSVSETITAEKSARLWLSAGPFHALPSSMLRRGSTCTIKNDVDGIPLTSNAACFWYASRSAQLSSGMARIRAAKDHCGRKIDSFSASCDERYFAFLPPILQPPLSSWLMEWTASDA